jgi:hypothetical protein
MKLRNVQMMTWKKAFDNLLQNLLIIDFDMFLCSGVYLLAFFYVAERLVELYFVFQSWCLFNLYKYLPDGSFLCNWSWIFLLWLNWCGKVSLKAWKDVQKTKCTITMSQKALWNNFHKKTNMSKKTFSPFYVAFAANKTETIKPNFSYHKNERKR